MRETSKQTREHVERLVTIQLLSHPRGRDRNALYRALRHSQDDAIDEAVVSLEQAGILTVAARVLHPSHALIRLEQLGLIGI